MEDRVLRMPEVCRLTGLSRSKVYELEDDPSFPPKAPLSGRTVGYLRSHVVAWMRQRFPEWTPPPLSESDSRALTAMAEWEEELDLLGAHAPIEHLQAHLMKAPGEGDMVSYLRGYLAGYARASKS